MRVKILVVTSGKKDNSSWYKYKKEIGWIMELNLQGKLASGITGLRAQILSIRTLFFSIALLIPAF